MTPSQPVKVPNDIRLIAAASRLLDLHQSRREMGGVYVPVVPERAGYYLTLALLILETLRDHEVENGIGYVAVTELFLRLQGRITELATEDVEYCLATLARQREVHFGIPDETGSIRYGETSKTTHLVETVEGAAQVQLSENGRLLLRITAAHESWLYADLDAERLVKAIERQQFYDIPRFCREMLLDIASKGLRLTQALERPSLSELRESLISDGQQIAQALGEASVVIKQARSLAYEQRTAEDFRIWWQKQPISPEFQLGNIQAELDLVLQNAEILSRKFVEFLHAAQQVRNAGTEHIRFLDLAQYLVASCEAGTAPRLEALLSELLPWSVESSFYHPSLLTGSVDFYGLLKEVGNISETVSAELSSHGVQTKQQARFHEFFRRNMDRLLPQLMRRPMRFSEILTFSDFDLHPGESPLDFFGVYSFPEQLDTEQWQVIVGETGDEIAMDAHHHRVVSSDPLLCLKEHIL